MIRNVGQVLLPALSFFPLYASPQTCVPCHRTETVAFARSAMPRALENAVNSAILRAHPELSTKIDGYSYKIEQSVYTVTDGVNTISVPLVWAFGQGSVGQTWLFRREGRWYESRVSYYSALHGLDITIGVRDIEVHNLEEAAGRALSSSDTTDCFACHATNAVKKSQLDLTGMEPGVQCERCHRRAEAHVQTKSPMRSLSAMTTEEMSDFCGECHRSWSHVMANGPHGVLNVRFQPYRLTLSKCYDAEDRRIRCTACHDPHKAMETSAKSYDGKCLACHSPGAKPATAASRHICAVAKTNCVTCHMPKIELPGAHKMFSDHRIRIAKANEKYPD